MSICIEIEWKDGPAKGFIDEIPLEPIVDHKRRLAHFFYSVSECNVYETRPRVRFDGKNAVELEYISEDFGAIPGILRIEFEKSLRLNSRVTDVYWRGLNENGKGEPLATDDYKVVGSDDEGFAKTEKIGVRKQRLYQRAFRREVIDWWDGKCAVTRIREDALLRASHIAPHATFKKARHRINPVNGLSLVANLDALFDRGLISFSDEGKLIVHPDHAGIGDLKIEWGKRQLIPPKGKTLDKHIEYLRFHRKLYNFPD